MIEDTALQTAEISPPARELFAVLIIAALSFSCFVMQVAASARADSGYCEIPYVIATATVAKGENE